MRANKHLGQHFLTDPSVVQAIAQNHSERARAILEVGPGLGVLTSPLSRLGRPFKVVERDPRFAAPLLKWLPRQDIVVADALKFNWEAAFKQWRWPKLWLVSNLPYNASAPLLAQFLQCPSIQFMTLMFQREVARKICAFEPRPNGMNSLMALTQNYFEVRLLKNVPPGAFRPAP